MAANLSVQKKSSTNQNSEGVYEMKEAYDDMKCLYERRILELENCVQTGETVHKSACKCFELKIESLTAELRTNQLKKDSLEKELERIAHLNEDLRLYKSTSDDKVQRLYIENKQLKLDIENLRHELHFGGHQQTDIERSLSEENEVLRQSVNEANENLSRFEEELINLQSIARSKNDEYEFAMHEVKEQQVQIDNLERQCQNKNDLITQLSQSVGRLKENCYQQEAQFLNKGNTNALHEWSKEFLITEKATFISSHNKVLAEKDRIILEKDRRMREQDVVLQNLNKQLARYENEWNDVQNTTKRFEDEIKVLHQQLKQEQHKNEELTKHERKEHTEQLTEMEQKLKYQTKSCIERDKLFQEWDCKYKDALEIIEKLQAKNIELENTIKKYHSEYMEIDKAYDRITGMFKDQDSVVIQGSKLNVILDKMEDAMASCDVKRVCMENQSREIVALQNNIRRLTHTVEDKDNIINEKDAERDKLKASLLHIKRLLRKNNLVKINMDENCEWINRVKSKIKELEGSIVSKENMLKDRVKSFKELYEGLEHYVTDCRDKLREFEAQQKVITDLQEKLSVMEVEIQSKEYVIKEKETVLCDKEKDLQLVKSRLMEYDETSDKWQDLDRRLRAALDKLEEQETLLGKQAQELNKQDKIKDEIREKYCTESDAQLLVIQKQAGDIERLKSLAQILEEDNIEQKNVLEQQKQQLEELQKELGRVKRHLNGKEQCCNEQCEEIQKLKEQIHGQMGEIQQNDNQLAAMKTELARVSNELEAYKENIKEQADIYYHNLSTSDCTITDLKITVSKHEQDILSKQEAIQQLQTAMCSARKHWETETKELLTQVSECKENAQRLMQLKLEHEQQISELQTALEDKTDIVNELESECDDKEVDIKEKYDTINQLQEQLANKEQGYTEIEQELNRVRIVLSATQEELKRTTTSSETRLNEMSQMLKLFQDACTANEKAIVQLNLELAKERDLSKAKKKKLELYMSMEEEFANVKEECRMKSEALIKVREQLHKTELQLEEKIKVCHTIEHDLLASDEELSTMMKDFSVIKQELNMEQVEKGKLVEEVKSLEDELQEVKEELETKETNMGEQIKRYEEILEEVKEELNMKNAENEEKDNTIRSMKKNLDAMSDKLSKRKEILNLKQRQIKELTEHLECDRHKLQDLEQMLKTKDKSLQELLDNWNFAESLIKEQGTELTKAKREAHAKSHDIEKLQKDVEKYTNELEYKHSETQTLQSQLEKVDTLSDMIASLKAEVELKGEKLKEYEDVCSKQYQEIEDQGQNIRAMRQQLNEQVTAFEERLNKLNKEIHNKNKDIKALEKQIELDADSLEKLHRQNENLHVELTGLSTRLQDQMYVHMNLQDEHSKVQKEFAEQAKQLQERNELNRETKKLIEEQGYKISDIEKDKDRFVKELRDKKEEIDCLKSIVNEQVKKFDAVTRTSQETTSKVTLAEARIEDYEMIIASKEAKYAKLESHLEEKRKEISKLRDSLMDKDEMIKSLRASLKKQEDTDRRRDEILLHQDDTLKEYADKLKEHEKLMQENLPRIKDLMDQLKKKDDLIKDLNVKYKDVQRAYHAKDSLLYEQGKLIENREAENNKVAESLQEKTNAVKKLKEKIEQVNNELKEANQNLERREKEYKCLKRLLKSQAEKSDLDKQALEEIDNLKKHVKDKENVIKDHEQEIESLAEKIEEARKKNRFLSMEYEKNTLRIEEKLALKTRELETIEVEKQMLEVKVQTLTEVIERKNELQTETAGTTQELQQKIRVQEGEIESKSRLITEIRGQSEKLKKHRHLVQKRMDEQTAKLQELLAECESKNKRIQELQRKIREMEDMLRNRMTETADESLLEENANLEHELFEEKALVKKLHSKIESKDNLIKKHLNKLLDYEQAIGEKEHTIRQISQHDDEDRQRMFNNFESILRKIESKIRDATSDAKKTRSVNADGKRGVLDQIELAFREEIGHFRMLKKQMESARQSFEVLWEEHCNELDSEEKDIPIDRDNLGEGLSARSEKSVSQTSFTFGEIHSDSVLALKDNTHHNHFSGGYMNQDFLTNYSSPDVTPPMTGRWDSPTRVIYAADMTPKDVKNSGDSLTESIVVMDDVSDISSIGH